MRKLLRVSTAALMALAVTTAAQASTFVPEDSTVSISLGVIHGPRIAALPGTEGSVSLVDNGTGGHIINLDSSVWSTVNLGHTSLYTGVPLISNIKVTFANRAGTFTSGFSHVNFAGGGTSVLGPCFGGQAPLSGNLMLSLLKGLAYVTLDMAHVGGAPGGTVGGTGLGFTIHLTASPWVTGPAPVTGITTNVISVNGVVGASITLRVTPSMVIHTLSTGGGYVSVSGGLPKEYHTVTLQGANELLSMSRDGVITLVAPMRIDTTSAISGRMPGAAWMDLTFVPEPATMLLLVTGAIGLAALGRVRTRRHE
jgi:hypothetical protein